MAASRVNRLRPGGGLLLGPIVALVVHHGAEVLSADACLDHQGGAFNDETPECSVSQLLLNNKLRQATAIESGC